MIRFLLLAGIAWTNERPVLMLAGAAAVAALGKFIVNAI